MLSRSALLLQSVVNHYERLGLKLALPKGLVTTAPTAPSEEVFRYQDFTVTQIKAAYRKRALECHPDVALDHEKAAAEAEFRRISESFALLQDVVKRKALDDDLQARFDERITKKHGGSIVYQRKGAGEGSKDSRSYTGHAAVRHRQREAEKARAEEKRPFTANATGSAKEEPERQFVDEKGNLRSTMPVGRGFPSYEKYLRGVEIDENTPLSQMTSTWVRSTEHSSNFANDDSSATATASSSSSNKTSAGARPRSQRPAASSAMRSRRPFLRGDADKAFREAFDGKTWNEVLFQMRYESRYGGGEAAKAGHANEENASNVANTSAAVDTPANGAKNTNYKLQSPLLRNARPLRADQTAASVLNQRYGAFQQAGGARLVGGPSSTPTYTSADGGSGPRRCTVSGADNLIETSAIYLKMAEFADSQFARQEYARDASDSNHSEKSVAQGGPVNFPHVSPQATASTGINTEQPLSAKKVRDLAKAKFAKIRPKYARAMRIAQAQSKSRALQDRTNIQTNAGKLYSYQRPY